MHRVQLLCTVALASRHFMPGMNAAPAAPAAMAAQQIAQPVEVMVVPSAADYVVPEAPARSGFSSGAVAAFVGVLVGASASAVLKSQGAQRKETRMDYDLEGMGFDALDLTVPRPRVVMASMSSTAASALESMEGLSVEVGNKVWDPLGLGTIGSEETLRFFRHAELKHGRVAMAACTGLLFHINHIHFPGMLSPTFGISFEKLSAMGPFEAWNTVPLLGQLQILWTIAGLEHASECLNPAGHYTKGGTPGDLKFLKNFWDTPGFLKKATPEQLAEKRLQELKNGRLAMIGIMSVCAAMNIPGSVPLLDPLVKDVPLLTGPGFALPFGTF